MWVLVGRASAKEMFVVGLLPSLSNVHTPFGPLEISKREYVCQRNPFNQGRTNFTLLFGINCRFLKETLLNFSKDNYYLKSGIPAEVLIPAPVCTTTCFA